jgi:hypothetical protein
MKRGRVISLLVVFVVLFSFKGIFSKKAIQKRSSNDPLFYHDVHLTRKLKVNSWEGKERINYDKEIEKVDEHLGKIRSEPVVNSKHKLNVIRERVERRELNRELSQIDAQLHGYRKPKPQVIEITKETMELQKQAEFIDDQISEIGSNIKRKNVISSLRVVEKHGKNNLVNSTKTSPLKIKHSWLSKITKVKGKDKQLELELMRANHHLEEIYSRKTDPTYFEKHENYYLEKEAVEKLAPEELRVQKKAREDVRRISGELENDHAEYNELFELEQEIKKLNQEIEF